MKLIPLLNLKFDESFCFFLIDNCIMFTFKKITYYHSNKKVSYQKTKSGLIINVNQEELNEIDTIIKLEI